MEQSGTDRRVRKTKSQLRLALMELLVEKSAKNISVRELAERADINRGTFYIHYRDVGDLLQRLEDEMADHAFHEKILAIAGNAYIQEFCSALWVPIARLDYLFFRDNHMASSAQDHRTIIDSFRIRDPFGAELAMKNNWNYSMLAVEASASAYEYER